MGKILLKHKIEYPCGKKEIIKHYGIFTHSSCGFGFYMNKTKEGQPPGEYIFISSVNIRKITPQGEA